MNRKANMEETQQFSNIVIQGRHVDITDAIKKYALEKVSKIERFSPRLVEAIITLDLQKGGNHIVNILMRFDTLRVRVEAITNDMYASIDKAHEKLKKLLRKYKDKINDHHKHDVVDPEMNVDVVRLPELDENEVNEEIEEENVKEEIERCRPHQIVKKEKKTLKMLTSYEAIVKMEISGEPFMIYRSEEDRKIKVIYRREDDNFGIIEPEG